MAHLGIISYLPWHGLLLLGLLGPAEALSCQCIPYRYTTDTLEDGRFRVDKYLLESKLETREVTEAGLLEQLRVQFAGATVILQARLEQSQVVADSGKLIESLESKYTMQPDTVRSKVLSILKGSHVGDSVGFKYGGHACDHGNFGNLKGLELLLRDTDGTWTPSVVPMDCLTPAMQGVWLVGGRIYRWDFGEVSVTLSQFQAQVSFIARRKSGHAIFRFTKRILERTDFLGRRHRL